MPSSSLTIDSVVSQKADVLSAAIGDEIVLASVPAGMFCGMDDIGADLWARIATPRKVRDLVAALATSYDGQAEQISEDVLATLKRLHDQGFVDIVG
jgi:hypothetical protein